MWQISGSPPQRRYQTFWDHWCRGCIFICDSQTLLLFVFQPTWRSFSKTACPHNTRPLIWPSSPIWRGSWPNTSRSKTSRLYSRGASWSFLSNIFRYEMFIFVPFTTDSSRETAATHHLQDVQLYVLLCGSVVGEVQTHWSQVLQGPGFILIKCMCLLDTHVTDTRFSFFQVSLRLSSAAAGLSGIHSVSRQRKRQHPRQRFRTHQTRRVWVHQAVWWLHLQRPWWGLLAVSCYLLTVYD